MPGICNPYLIDSGVLRRELIQMSRDFFMSSNEYFEGLKVRPCHDLDSWDEMAAPQPNRCENTYDVQGRQAKYGISLRFNISKLRCPQPCSNRPQMVESYGSDPVIVGGRSGGRLHILKSFTLQDVSRRCFVPRVHTN
jgi:hypothetical protein